jgi:hypothetical protein
MSDTAQQQETSRVTGQVKWFNNKAGFGFITVCSGFEHSGKDIFVHYSAISVSNSQYKYLIQGEYVDFDIVKPDNDKHEFHAVNITGVRNGNIMCETRRTLSQSSGYVPHSRSENDLPRNDGFEHVSARKRREPQEPRTSSRPVRNTRQPRQKVVREAAPQTA